MSRVTEARDLAIRAHGEQRYGGKPYVAHLDAVATLCAPCGEDAEIVGYLHDVLEDTDCTRAQIEAAFGAFIATCVEILTDPPGPTRTARKAALHARLAAIAADAPEKVALVVKAADRLANVKASAEEGNTRLLAMYREEHAAFRSAVLRAGLNDALIQAIDRVLG
jgi:(p)ppGpp synthase/HD superfamily hydrolase